MTTTVTPYAPIAALAPYRAGRTRRGGGAGARARRRGEAGVERVAVRSVAVGRGGPRRGVGIDQPLPRRHRRAAPRRHRRVPRVRRLRGRRRSRLLRCALAAGQRLRRPRRRDRDAHADVRGAPDHRHDVASGGRDGAARRLAHRRRSAGGGGDAEDQDRVPHRSAQPDRHGDPRRRRPLARRSPRRALPARRRPGVRRVRRARCRRAGDDLRRAPRHDRAAHLLQGLRAGRAAGRLRPRRPAGGDGAAAGRRRRSPSTGWGSSVRSPR